MGEYAAAGPIPRLEHGDGPAPARKIMRCSESGESRADDDASSGATLRFGIRAAQERLPSIHLWLGLQGNIALGLRELQVDRGNLARETAGKPPILFDHATRRSRWAPSTVKR